MNKEIYVTKEGYSQYVNKLKELEYKIDKNNKEKSEAMLDAPGDGWHDNFAAEDAARKERILLDELDMLKLQRHNICIIKSTFKEGYVNIGDTLRLDILGDIEVVKLTGNYLALEDEISLNSPLGKAILHKKYNSDVTYEVNGKTIEVKIIEKVG